MTFNIVCCHFRKERDFTLSLSLIHSLTYPLTRSSLTAPAPFTVRTENKTKQNTIETTTIQLSTTLSALCCVVWQFVLWFRMQPHSVSQSLSTHIPSTPNLRSLCVHCTSFDQTQEANKENQSQVHMFRWQKAQLLVGKTNICKSTLVDHAYEMAGKNPLYFYGIFLKWFSQIRPTRQFDDATGFAKPVYLTYTFSYCCWVCNQHFYKKKSMLFSFAFHSFDSMHNKVNSFNTYTLLCW